MSKIEFLNRYTGETEAEEIYGEAYLRWTYETKLGQMALWLLLRRSFFSAWYGWRMSRAASRKKVISFIETFGLDIEEFADAPESYSTFNDFFYRKLKPEARPLIGDEKSVVFGADGRHFGIQNVSRVDTIYAKGQAFSVDALVGDPKIAQRFDGGIAIISRLCPVDYHRFHSPVAGKVVSRKLIGGDLFSVSPVALSRKIDYLWKNKRVLNVIETESFGTVAFIAIGATCVGSIKMTAGVGDEVEKGGELGYFEFGGSCVVTLFEPDRIELSEDLVYAASQGRELYAMVRDVAGRLSEG